MSKSKIEARVEQAAAEPCPESPVELPADTEAMFAEVEESQRVFATDLEYQQAEEIGRLKKVAAGMGAVNAQNEELRIENKALNMRIDLLQGLMERREESQPRFAPSAFLVDKPVFVIDQTGMGWFIHPADATIKRAWA